MASPYIYIEVNGIALAPSILNLVTSVSYEEVDTGSDILTITASDPDFIFINSTMFVEDYRILFRGGYTDNFPIVFKGYVAVIDPSFGDESPTITVTCMDESYIMDKKKKKRTWKNTSISAIAESMFKSYGFKAVVDSTKVKKSITQSNQTDIDFLTQEAGNQEVPYICYVKNGVGYFVKRDCNLPVQATLWWGKQTADILDFSPRVTITSKSTSSEESDINTESGSEVTSVTDSNTKTINSNTGSSTSTPSYVLNKEGVWVKKGGK